MYTINNINLYTKFSIHIKTNIGPIIINYIFSNNKLNTSILNTSTFNINSFGKTSNSNSNTPNTSTWCKIIQKKVFKSVILAMKTIILDKNDIFEEVSSNTEVFNSCFMDNIKNLYIDKAYEKK